jgi:hypothetical protein
MLACSIIIAGLEDAMTAGASLLPADLGVGLHLCQIVVDRPALALSSTSRNSTCPDPPTAGPLDLLSFTAIGPCEYARDATRMASFGGGEAGWGVTEPRPSLLAALLDMDAKDRAAGGEHDE